MAAQARDSHSTRMGLMAVAALGAAALVAPAPAGAAVTIGQTANANQATCGSDSSRVQVSVSSGASYIAPSNGVIVQWRYPTFAVANQPQPRLKVYDPVGPPASTTSWFLRSHSAVKPTPPQSTLNVYNESPGIPIQAGDHLGMSGIGFGGVSNTSCISAMTTMADLHRYNGGGDPSPPGFNYMLTNDSTFIRLAIAADIEPDADGDLFGDETQDQCPTDPTTQGVCPVNLGLAMVAAPEPVTVGQDITYTLSVTNGSTNPAPNVIVSDAIPSGTTFKSSSTSQGTCAGSTTVGCNLGAIGPSGAATVMIVVTTTAAGTVSNTASVTSGAPDPNPANNSATANSTVNDAGGGGGGGTDTTPPNGTLEGKSKQDVDKLALTVGSDEAAAATGIASANVPGGKKPVTSKPATGSVPANGKLTLKFKFKKKTLRKIKRTIAKGKKPKAMIAVTITDGAGNKTALSKSVKLKD